MRIQINEYRRALIQVIREDAADLIELMNLHETINDLEMRINEPALYSAAGRLTAGILKEVNASSPLRVTAREFNSGAEQFYRTTLRHQHIEEAFEFLLHDCSTLDRAQSKLDDSQRKALRVILQGQEAARFVMTAKEDVVHEQADTVTLQRLMNLLLFNVHHDHSMNRSQFDNQGSNRDDAAPVYRAG
jgi:hypothetical protein